MPDTVRPRREPMWRFFDEHVDAVGPVRLGTLAELGRGDREAAEAFVAALKGCCSVIDLGCGAGLPGLYIAPHVGGIVCIDAAPNMVAAARDNAERLGITNASFRVGGTEGLPFGNGEFDGTSLCGMLGSTDWEGVHGMLSEVRRVLESGGRIAVLELDWQHVIRTKPSRERAIRFDNGRLLLRIVERSASPHLERDTRYLIDPDSSSGRRLRRELGSKERACTTMDADDLEPADILDAWYDEGARFDTRTLREVITREGFHDIRIEPRRLWKEEIVFLMAHR